MTTMNNSSLLWIERYRPTDLSEIKSQKNIINSIEKFLTNKNLPHLLFFGSSGTGKTSCIHCACKKLYGDNYRYMILELNASDNRGIDTVRQQIYEFANTKSMINDGIKTIILDEADSMTIMAQNALRKIIENNSDNVRFCIICNYVNKIIPALKSRCIQFRFSPLKEDAKLEILQNILKNEKFNINDEYLKIIIKIANGDMRRSINMLQSLSIIYRNNKNKITRQDIFDYFNIISDKDFKYIWKVLNNEDNIQNKINTLQKFILVDNDHNLHELLEHITDKILETNYSNEKKIFLFHELAKIEEAIIMDYIPELIISSIISIFVKLNSM